MAKQRLISLQAVLDLAHREGCNGFSHWSVTELLEVGDSGVVVQVQLQPLSIS